MDDLTRLDAETLEGIDACRPNRGDDRLPELAAVFDRVQNQPAAARRFDSVQRIDAALLTAMHDVPLPAGLAERLYERLQAHVTVADPTVATSTAKRRSRLRWALALAASLVIVTGMTVAWRWLPAQPGNIVTLAETWDHELSRQWRPLATAPRGLAVPVRLSVAPRGWQPTTSLQGYRGVAYDFSSPGRRAILFVVYVVPSGELPIEPPDSPQYSAGGRLLAAWVTGQRMCLLVVEGDSRAYRDLIRPRLGPIAMLVSSRSR